MDRHWFLTNTCYGNWLPGDARGFVGQVWEHRPYEMDEKPRINHPIVGTEYDQDLPKLKRASETLLKCPAIHLNVSQAEVLLGQFRVTAAHRGWQLLAVAIMYNHFHIVVGVDRDPSPSKILGDFKSWGTRKLSERYGAPPSET